MTAKSIVHLFKERFPAIARGLALAALAALLPAPAAGDSGGDGLPAGMVAFVDGGGCPTGWSVAGYASGRLVVGVTFGDQVGVTIGTPLADQEDRTHAHGYTAMVDLPYKSISAADGSNDQGAAAMTYSWSDAVTPATTGLPFIQLAICEKQ